MCRTQPKDKDSNLFNWGGGFPNPDPTFVTKNRFGSYLIYVDKKYTFQFFCRHKSQYNWYINTVILQEKKFDVQTGSDQNLKRIEIRPKFENRIEIRLLFENRVRIRPKQPDPKLWLQLPMSFTRYIQKKTHLNENFFWHLLDLVLQLAPLRLQTVYVRLNVGQSQKLLITYLMCIVYYTNATNLTTKMYSTFLHYQFKWNFGPI